MKHIIWLIVGCLCCVVCIYPVLSQEQDHGECSDENTIHIEIVQSTAEYSGLRKDVTNNIQKVCLQISNQMNSSPPSIILKARTNDLPSDIIINKNTTRIIPIPLKLQTSSIELQYRYSYYDELKEDGQKIGTQIGLVKATFTYPLIEPITVQPTVTPPQPTATPVQSTPTPVQPTATPSVSQPIVTPSQPPSTPSQPPSTPVQPTPTLPDPPSGSGRLIRLIIIGSIITALLVGILIVRKLGQQNKKGAPMEKQEQQLMHDTQAVSKQPTVTIGKQREKSGRDVIHADTPTPNMPQDASEPTSDNLSAGDMLEQLRSVLTLKPEDNILQAVNKLQRSARTVQQIQSMLKLKSQDDIHGQINHLQTSDQTVRNIRNVLQLTPQDDPLRSVQALKDEYEHFQRNLDPILNDRGFSDNEKRLLKTSRGKDIIHKYLHIVEPQLFSDFENVLREMQATLQHVWNETRSQSPFRGVLEAILFGEGVQKDGGLRKAIKMIQRENLVNIFNIENQADFDKITERDFFEKYVEVYVMGTENSIGIIDDFMRLYLYRHVEFIRNAFEEDNILIQQIDHVYHILVEAFHATLEIRLSDIQLFHDTFDANTHARPRITRSFLRSVRRDWESEIITRLPADTIYDLYKIGISSHKLGLERKPQVISYRIE